MLPNYGEHRKEGELWSVSRETELIEGIEWIGKTVDVPEKTPRFSLSILCPQLAPFLLRQTTVHPLFYAPQLATLKKSVANWKLRKRKRENCGASQERRS
jgi:hypothetical protein